MSCSQCACFKPTNADAGICQLNPPVFMVGKSPNQADSYHQPMTYEDWNCSKNVAEEATPEVEKTTTKPRGNKRGTKDKP